MELMMEGDGINTEILKSAERICKTRGWVTVKDVYTELTQHKWTGYRTPGRPISLQRISYCLRNNGYHVIQLAPHGRTKYARDDDVNS